MDSLLRELADIDAITVLRCDYQKTLALLRALKAGTVWLDNVTMTDGGWKVGAIAPPEPPAEEPVEQSVEEPIEEYVETPIEPNKIIRM